MSLARSRVLAVTVIATTFVASISWALVLVGAGDSHAASFRLVRGVSVVLHHDDEDVHALGHVHRHHGAAHEHSTADPHADDHVIAVSAEPASLRSQDGVVALDGGCAGAMGPVLHSTTMAAPVVSLRLVSAVPHAPQLSRATTVLLL